MLSAIYNVEYDLSGLELIHILQNCEYRIPVVRTCSYPCNHRGFLVSIISILPIVVREETQKLSVNKQHPC